MISIIIPVLNEEGTIEKLLWHLSATISGKHSVELIVVDGGSTDGTKNRVMDFKPQRFSKPLGFMTAEIGRAKQMNAGAAMASGEVLYFLHSDSFPPKNFDVHIFDEINKGNPAGCFRMKFDSNHWWLWLCGWFTRFNWRMCRGGDQSLFITQKLFKEIGGFDERYKIYEDNILIQTLYSLNKFKVIPQTLTTSARLYREKGIWKLQFHFLIIHLKKRWGADANELYAYYSKHIKNSNV